MGKKKYLNISKGDFVLEIGSGHRPCSRSNILCDKYISDDTQRGGRIIIDRPFVQADAQKLPFKDGTFDYVICKHVLEHLDDPENFFKEISRVAKRGYIEAPSLMWEKLHSSREYHKWLILNLNDTLILMPKTEIDYDSIFGVSFEFIASNSLEYRLFLKVYEHLFLIRYEWDGIIKYNIKPQDPYLKSFFEEPWDRDKIELFVQKRNFVKQLLGLINTGFTAIIQKLRLYS